MSVGRTRIGQIILSGTLVAALVGAGAVVGGCALFGIIRIEWTARTRCAPMYAGSSTDPREVLRTALDGVDHDRLIIRSIAAAMNTERWYNYGPQARRVDLSEFQGRLQIMRFDDRHRMPALEFCFTHSDLEFAELSSQLVAAAYAKYGGELLAPYGFTITSSGTLSFGDRVVLREYALIGGAIGGGMAGLLIGLATVSGRRQGGAGRAADGYPRRSRGLREEMAERRIGGGMARPLVAPGFAGGRGRRA